MAVQPTGLFVPTTQSWDISDIPQELSKEQLKELLVRLYQNLNTIALVLNRKESAYYPLNQDFVTSAQYFPNATTPTQFRSVVRTVIDFGALPNTATKNVAHNINFNRNYTLTRFYGAATDSTGLNYIPLPYASTVLANSIELSLTGANVVVTTGSNRSNFNRCIIVIEYLVL
jgi:hypothetical protein